MKKITHNAGNAWYTSSSSVLGAIANNRPALYRASPPTATSTARQTLLLAHAASTLLRGGRAGKNWCAPYYPWTRILAPRNTSSSSLHIPRLPCYTWRCGERNPCRTAPTFLGTKILDNSEGYGSRYYGGPHQIGPTVHTTTYIFGCFY